MKEAVKKETVAAATQHWPASGPGREKPLRSRPQAHDESIDSSWGRGFSLPGQRAGPGVSVLSSCILPTTTVP